MRITELLSSRHLMRTLVVGVLSTQLMACWGLGCDNCSPPKAAISELRLHGVTLTTATYPFPLAIGLELTSDVRYSMSAPIDSLDTYELKLVFSPPEDRLNFVQPTGNEWDEHPYAYAFSKLVNDEFMLIKPLLPFNYSVAPTTDLTSAYGPIKIENSPPELILYGNHLLTAIPAIPLHATHIELWHREQREDELTFIRRVDLNNLYAWRQYYKPKIDEISN